MGIIVAFPDAFADIGPQLWARSGLGDLTTDGHKLSITIAGHIDGTLLTLGAGVLLAGILTDTTLALRLLCILYTTYSIGALQFPAGIFVALAVARWDFVGCLIDGFCGRLGIVR